MVSIRPARHEDAASVIALANELNRYEGKPLMSLSPEAFCDSAFGPTPWFQCLVAEREGRIIGYAAYSRSFELEAGGRRLHLIDLFVLPEARRQGVARALMAELARIALELECEHIGWEVLTWNTEAQAFYRSICGEAEVVLSYWLGPKEIKDLASRASKVLD
jgi:ribosomal protein S18 acetylase RimI-like enzyme